jgi:predicted nucleotidyltransferase
MRELSNDLREFIHLLNAKKVRYLLVGAWAVAFHARPRYTADVDFFVEPGSENAVRLMEVIEEFGFGGIGIEAADFLQTDCVIQLGRAPNRVDLLTGISGVSFGEAWADRLTASLSGVEVTVIGREHLIRNKRAANRAKDRADVEWLERTGR